MLYLHALNLFKNWNTHSIESGGFFELLISKKVIYEEQKQLRSLVQVKEMANCSFAFINEQFRYNARSKQCRNTKFLRRIYITSSFFLYFLI